MKKFLNLTYFLAIYADPAGGCRMIFADFKRVVNHGDSVEDAISRSRIYLGALATDMVEHDAPFPVPSLIQDFRDKLIPEDGVPLCIVPISVHIPVGKVGIRFVAS